MKNPSELASQFWKSITSDKVMMLGLKQAGALKPMTAQLEEERGPLWFFTANDNDIVRDLSTDYAAIASFASKGHDLFAMIQGTLRIDNDRAVIDRLWNPFVAAWYKGGKADPSLVLLRFDVIEAEIWLADAGLLSAVKVLLGADPRKEFADHKASVTLS